MEELDELHRVHVLTRQRRSIDAEAFQKPVNFNLKREGPVSNSLPEYPDKLIGALMMVFSFLSSLFGSLDPAMCLL